MSRFPWLDQLPDPEVDPAAADAILQRFGAADDEELRQIAAEVQAATARAQAAGGVAAEMVGWLRLLRTLIGGMV